MQRLDARPVLWRTKLPPSLSKAGIQLLAPRAADRVSAFPTELSTVVMQERVAVPSMCTVQAPQSAIPQPSFVPVIPSTPPRCDQDIFRYK